MIPESLKKALRPITVVVGHYGAGKTNFAVNLALDLSAEGTHATVVDLDIVNPYFRASEQRAVLEQAGVALVAPVFAEAGTSLDVPSLTGRIDSTLHDARADGIVIIDAGGDDVGATALGRYARAICAHDYAMLYVANRFRNLVQDPADALVNLREIENASHLSVTALVNNSHLKDATSETTVQLGFAYASKLADITGLPLACTSMPAAAMPEGVPDAYIVQARVKNPWE